LNCGSLLHPRDQKLGAQAIGFGEKVNGRVVGVDGGRQVLEGGHGNAVSLIELADSPIAQTHTQHVADQGLVPQRRPQPRGVVIAPDEGDIGLLAQVVDDAVAARSAVPAVAADNQLVNRQVPNQPAHHVNQMQRLTAAYQLVHDRLEELLAALGRGLVEHFR